MYPNRVKEIGWYDIELTEASRADPLFAGCNPIERVFQWHGDTFDLPDGAVNLARSPHCEQQAFRYGPAAYGLQFHIEVTSDMIADWVREDGNCGELSTFDYTSAEAILQETPARIGALQTLGNRVLRRFATLCKNRE